MKEANPYASPADLEVDSGSPFAFNGNKIKKMIGQNGPPAIPAANVHIKVSTDMEQSTTVRKTIGKTRRTAMGIRRGSTDE
mmetsp:Transcript_18985/g.43255  ORF Transcript_18985/g.43255 Transcript_18985/m.43255 type:complete len:81 (-) Transcript_18985:1144-1386(-)